MNKRWITTGIVNLVTALIHTVVGQMLLIEPYILLNFDPPLKAILHACWHMVTFTLFFTTFIFFAIGIKPQNYISIHIATFLAVLYIGYSMTFGVMSLIYGIFMYQSIMLLLIGGLAIMGTRGAQDLAGAKNR